MERDFKFKKELDDIEAIVGECDVTSEALVATADNLIKMIFEIDGSCDKKFASDRTRALALLMKISDVLDELYEEERFNYYIKAFMAFAKGNIDICLYWISKHIKIFFETSNVIFYEYAQLNYISVFRYISPNAPSFTPEIFLRKFHAILKKHCPGTAFELYVKYKLSKANNFYLREKYLLEILDKDGQWAAAYTELGDLHFEKSEWRKATEYYKKAMEISDYDKTDLGCFRLACSYSELTDFANEEKAYKSCLEINPSFSIANNNLGYCLYKQKKYSEAIYYFDVSIQLEMDGVFPYRNKFDTLKKMGRNAEAEELAKEHPEHFNTKYYKEEMSKIMGTPTKTIDIVYETNASTESDFSGKMLVSDKRSGIELYPHQREAIQAMNRSILNAGEYAGLLVLPTGGGKTLTASYWLMENLLDRGKKILWIAHRHELLNQAKESFERVCYNDVSRNKPSYNWRIISGQHDKPVHIKPTDDIIIASKTSLTRGLNYFIQNWLEVNGNSVFLIINEAHHAVAGEYRELINSIKAHSNNFKMLGLTATPFRTAENEQGLLKKIFPDDIVYKIDLRELINRGILSEPIFKSVSTDINMVDLFETSNSEKALKRIANESFFDIESIGKEAANAIAFNSKRNSAIVREYVKNKAFYKQTLVFALNVDMAIVLSGLFRDAGVRSDYVVSDVKDSATKVTISSEENRKKIQQFREGKLEVLVNVNILTEGTDLPKVQSVFLTRPTKSTILMTQMIGRALRGEKAGGTKDAYIVSFIDDWQGRIAWVNPEQLYIDENVDFSRRDNETQKMIMRLVSIAKLEEFARIANNTVDSRLSELPFIDRIPIGIYKFSYLAENSSEDETEKSCNVLVYNCMQKAYEDLFAWLPKADLSDADKAADHIDEMIFGEQELLLGYSRQDVFDIIMYYRQTNTIPQMILLSERGDYDITKVANYIVVNNLNQTDEKAYIESEWQRNDTHWAAFFGIDNQKAFRRLISDARERLKYPEDYEKPAEKPITEKEKVLVSDLTLQEIKNRLPELGEKIRNAVFEKYTDADGFYFSALSGYKSKNRLNFQIDHIEPMSKGGKTIPENLQLLTRAENMRKSDKLGGIN